MWRIAETAGYDFAAGAKLWTLNGGGDIPVPTPIFAHGCIYLTSAHGRWRPMRAIRPEAAGEITPEDPGKTNAFIAWAHGRQGNYMQTPLVAGDLLFGCNDNGLLTAESAGEKPITAKIVSVALASFHPEKQRKKKRAKTSSSQNPLWNQAPESLNAALEAVRGNRTATSALAELKVCLQELSQGQTS